LHSNVSNNLKGAGKMKTIGNLLFTCGALFLSGCVSPQLAETPLGETEQRWSEFLSDAYPEWRAPKTMPPVSEPFAPAIELQAPAVVQPQPEVPVVEIASPIEIQAPAGGLEAAPADPGIIQKVQSEEFDLYVIQKGDTLWKIANKFYKNGSKWHVIYDANREILPTPQSLKTGLELRIPLQ